MKLSTCGSACSAVIVSLMVLNGIFGFISLVEHRSTPTAIPSVQRKKIPYTVKAIVLPSRLEQTQRNLEKVFDHFELIPGFDKSQANLGLLESANVLDTRYDFDDKRIRDSYSIPYMQEGEVSCTLAHRRVLEKVRPKFVS